MRKTGRLLALDISHQTCSVSSEIVARVAAEQFGNLKCAPRQIALSDCPSPTSYGLTTGYYPGAFEISEVAVEMMRGRGMKAGLSELRRTAPHDVPGNWFKGPF